MATSYTAVTGAVTAVGEIQIPEPKNNERANIYTFEFILEDELPKAGYIVMFMPDDVTLSPSTT